MRTELDARMDATMAAVTGEGGMLPLGSIQRWGVDLPVIAVAPPSLPAYFAHYCREHAGATFLVAGDERLTFAEVCDVATAVARGLVARGIRVGDRVGIAGRNSPAWIATFMGVLMAGGVASLLNGWWQAEEFQQAIADVDCALIVADGPRAKRLAQIEGLAVPVVVLDDAAPLAEAVAPLATFAPGEAGDLPELGPDDLATILFTSGSTGLCKGAVSDHRAVLQSVFNYLAQALMMLGIAGQDGQAPEGQPSTMLTIPLFHVTAMVPVFLQSFAMGRKLVLMPKWDAKEAMRLIQAERVSYFVGVPLMSYEMAMHPDRDKYDLSQCKSFAAGGAPRPVEHVGKIKDAFPGGYPLLGYGLTETNAVGCGNLNENYMAKPGSTGLASKPLVDLAILDDDGRALAAGETGEVSIRSVCNFLGYWKNEEATTAAYTGDGYFRTGDLGYLDEDDYLFIVDRKKDIIIRGGENIACIEVEEAIYAHPGIAECSVFGLPDERFGEVPAAVYLVQPGRQLTPEALCDYLRGHIAAFKLPVHLWEAHEQLPRLGTQKVDKRAVKAMYAKDFVPA